ncbi:MAG: hypothetical protein IPM66_22055 [Acidobacteriota bacterium]|nr:MAG: hypothetical protein IPM66_22055 [Acidobacteriota bacterium]
MTSAVFKFLRFYRIADNDALYRLTSETISGDPTPTINGTISYTYDPVGNRLMRNSNVAGVPATTSTYDVNDRLGTDVYDANGNTTGSAGSNYQYDFENRLIAVNVGTSDEVRIVYDGDGNRVAKTLRGVTTKYLVDTNNLTGYAQVVEELQGGNVVQQYTYGHDLISQRQMIGGNWTTSFYQYDGHGSVRALMDSAGVITDTYAYDAFGVLISRTGVTQNNYLYAGEQFDHDIGLYFNRARYLNTQTGRFLTNDDFEGSKKDLLSLHKYLYANGNPVNKCDPNGRFSSLVGAVAVISAIAIISMLGHSLYSHYASHRMREDVVVRRAINNARHMVDIAIMKLDRWGATDQTEYEKWFGISDGPYYSKVVRVYTNIRAALGGIVTWYLRPDISRRTGSIIPDTLAYVYPGGPIGIYLPDLFFTLPAVGENSQAGTIVHELSHEVANTDDHAYGTDAAKELALIHPPTRAINNADNYEYFVEKAR